MVQAVVPVTDVLVGFSGEAVVDLAIVVSLGVVVVNLATVVC